MTLLDRIMASYQRSRTTLSDDQVRFARLRLELIIAELKNREPGSRGVPSESSAELNADATSAT
jgi:hypothetical protein